MDLRKEIEYQQARNNELAMQLRDMEFRVKDREDQQYAMRKDLDQSKYQNSQMRDGNIDMLSEKDALEKHAQVLQQQNDEISRELDKFCETDEYVRS